MKRKYSGLLTVIIAFSAFLLAAVYGIWTSGTKIPEIQMTEKIAPRPAIAVPPVSVVTEMDNLEEEMEAMIKLENGDTSEVDLRLFGYQPVKTAEPVLRTEAGKMISKNYFLSLAFVAEKKRFCIIDDVFYEEGGRLPDGSAIVKVEPQRVMIKSRNMTHWIPLAEKEVTAQKEGK
ncbi:MAG: hypothetical protein JXA41_07260 [Deltaproteobacteria bacterium]|nr:hypothetical protein [Deltaproteobacteria bacterium]